MADPNAPISNALEEVRNRLHKAVFNAKKRTSSRQQDDDEGDDGSNVCLSSRSSLGLLQGGQQQDLDAASPLLLLPGRPGKQQTPWTAMCPPSGFMMDSQFRLEGLNVVVGSGGGATSVNAGFCHMDCHVQKRRVLDLSLRGESLRLHSSYSSSLPLPPPEEPFGIFGTPLLSASGSRKQGWWGSAPVSALELHESLASLAQTTETWDSWNPCELKELLPMYDGSLPATADIGSRLLLAPTAQEAEISRPTLCTSGTYSSYSGFSTMSHDCWEHDPPLATLATSSLSTEHATRTAAAEEEEEEEEEDLVAWIPLGILG